MPLAPIYQENGRKSLCPQGSSEVGHYFFSIGFQHLSTHKICSFTVNCFSRSGNPKSNEKLNHVQHSINTSVNKLSNQNKENGNCTVNQFVGHFRAWSMTEMLGQPSGQPPWGMFSLNSSEMCIWEELSFGGAYFLSMRAKSLGFAFGVLQSTTIFCLTLWFLWQCNTLLNDSKFLISLLLINSMGLDNQKQRACPVTYFAFTWGWECVLPNISLEKGGGLRVVVGFQVSLSLSLSPPCLCFH